MIARIITASPAQQVSSVHETSLIRFGRWALYATVGCLPLYVVRWHYGPVPTTLLETLIIVTVLLYVVARWRDGSRRPVATPYDIPILLLLLAGAISVIVAKDHRGALGLYRAYFVEPIAIFYVAIDIVKDADHVKRLLIAFAAGSCVFALLNLAVFLQALVANNVHVGVAPNALYGDANYVAMYMEPPFALGAGLLLVGRGARWRLLGGAWALITGSALVVMFSKGSYLALGVFCIVIAITVPRWRLPLVAAVLVSLIAATQVPLAMQRLATVASSLNGRQQIFAATLDMLRNHPLFGLGLGGFTYQFRGSVPEVYPHDIWLTFWVEIGLLGVIAFAIILAGLLWRGWKAWPSSEGFHRPVLWGALGALVLWAAHGLVDSPYWKNDMSVEFWILAALLLVAVRSRSTNEPARRESSSSVVA